MCLYCQIRQALSFLLCIAVALVPDLFCRVGEMIMVRIAKLHSSNFGSFHAMSIFPSMYVLIEKEAPSGDFITHVIINSSGLIIFTKIRT